MQSNHDSTECLSDLVSSWPKNVSKLPCTKFWKLQGLVKLCILNPNKKDFWVQLIPTKLHSLIFRACMKTHIRIRVIVSTAELHMLVKTESQASSNETPCCCSTASESTAIRVAVRFQYAKDCNFIREETHRLSLQQLLLQVEEHNESSEQNMICCVNAGNGFYRIMELKNTIGMAIAIHKEASLQHEMMELEFFTATDLIHSLHEVGKVHLPALSKKGNRHFWFAEKNSACKDFLHVCKVSHHELRFKELMVRRGNEVLMTHSEMFKLNTAQIRDKLGSLDWICEAHPRKPFINFNPIIIDVCLTGIPLIDVFVIVKQGETTDFLTEFIFTKCDTSRI